MRKCVGVFFLIVLGLLSTAILGVGMALMSAISLAATTALIVPGTGTPDANVVDDYMPNFWNRYIGGTDPALPPECTVATDCTLTGINYPASFFPLVIFPGWCEPGRCETWNDSVGEGVTNLNGQLISLLANTDDDIVIAGYSQGGAVVSNELRNLAALDPDLKNRLSVFMIGNAYNPDGGLFTRLGFLPTIPFLNITFGPAMPTDTGIPITSVGFEYDPVMYAPLYWGNPLSLFNAFAAFDNVHGFYLTPNGNGPTDQIAYGYTEEELADILAGPCPGPNCRVDSEGNEYWMVPARGLPMMDLIMSVVPAPLAPFVQPLVDLTTPAAKVLIDLGYDWSGDPGQTRWLSPLPFSLTTNPLQVGVDLVEAIVEGIEDALGGGGSVMIAPPSDTDELALSASIPETEAIVEEEQDDAMEGLVTGAGEETGGDVARLTVATTETKDASTTAETTESDEATIDEDEAKDDEDEVKDDEDEAKDDEDEAKDDETDATDDDKQDATTSIDSDNDSDSDTGQAAA